MLNSELDRAVDERRRACTTSAEGVHFDPPIVNRRPFSV